MTLALTEPGMVSDIIAVDNAPLDTTLSSEFSSYIRGMMKIDDADVKLRTDADQMLSPYEEVPPTMFPLHARIS